VVLLLLDELLEHLRKCKFTKLFRLPDPLAVIVDRVILGPQIGPKHCFVFLGDLDGGGRVRRIRSVVVDLPGDRERVVELLVRMLLELASDVLEARGIELLTENHVLDDRLVLAGEVLLKSLHELVASHRSGRALGRGGRGLLCHDRSLAYECEIGHCAFPECKYETGHEARERALRRMNWLATSCDGLRALVGTRKIMMSSTHPSALRAASRSGSNRR
jgi:hypothetical protein